jgi:hypothetical protein
VDPVPDPLLFFLVYIYIYIYLLINRCTSFRLHFKAHRQVLLSASSVRPVKSSTQTIGTIHGTEYAYFPVALFVASTAVVVFIFVTGSQLFCGVF